MEIDYDITNCLKFNWYDTQAYKFNRDDNNGYIHGFVKWFGKQTLDNAIDNDDGTDVQWSWFKTEEERDKIFLEREKNNGKGL